MSTDKITIGEVEFERGELLEAVTARLLKETPTILAGVLEDLLAMEKKEGEVQEDLFDDIEAQDESNDED